MLLDNQDEVLFEIRSHLKTSLLSNEINNKVHFDSKVGAYKTERAIATEKRIIKEALEESYQDLKSGTKGWKNIFGKSSVFEF